MALEDLTGTKYINALVATNPVSTPTPDKRHEGAHHTRGTKNVILQTFVNITGPVTADEDELNLMTGLTSIPDGFASGDTLLFYQASAPTGWTQETALANLDGATLRVETGTGGGAVAGTHDVASPPSINHTHTDTFAAAATAITAAQMPTHRHLWIVNSTSSGTYGSCTSSQSILKQFTDTNNENSKVDLDSGSTLDANVGKSSNVGSGSTHTHTVDGSVDSATLTAFAPKYVNMIVCAKD